MSGKTMVGILGIAAGAALAVALILAGGGTAGEWHTGTNNLCTDCHTMHFSMQHNWDGTTPVPSNPAANGSWLGASGPNAFLLKAPVNQLCLSCHDGQTFAPDVFEVNTSAGSYTQGRSGGGLNETGSTPYETWKGHTLGNTAAPPGYNPAAVGLSATWYDNTQGLECTSCHTQHGVAGVYRNLGPRSLGSANLPTYVISTTNDTTKDVWINLATYTVNSGNAATFGPFYDSANVSYNRVDKTVGATKTSNGVDTMCGACHGNFHGGPGDAGIGGSVGVLDGFIRHPTAQTVIGASGAQGYGGHSALSRYTGQPGVKAKVYANDRTGFTDATPGCVSCHKAHGNQNPFGLMFVSHTGNTNYSAAYPEEGNYDPTTPYMQGYRNLCGQCHGQGN